ncbi:MAG: hypothetical protein KME50_00035 [Nostoc desertorum CM1-VF14]|nr:hypothetical protein [Nostoc desertorum CM1-VF14]
MYAYKSPFKRRTLIAVSPLSYGVHTSLKILPSTWFRHLALGCAIAHREGTTFAPRVAETLHS